MITDTARPQKAYESFAFAAWHHTNNVISQQVGTYVHDCFVACGTEATLPLRSCVGCCTSRPATCRAARRLHVGVPRCTISFWPFVQPFDFAKHPNTQVHSAKVDVDKIS